MLPFGAPNPIWNSHQNSHQAQVHGMALLKLEQTVRVVRDLKLLSVASTDFLMPIRDAE